MLKDSKKIHKIIFLKISSFNYKLLIKFKLNMTRKTLNVNPVVGTPYFLTPVGAWRAIVH